MKDNRKRELTSWTCGWRTNDDCSKLPNERIVWRWDKIISKRLCWPILEFFLLHKLGTTQRRHRSVCSPNVPLQCDQSHFYSTIDIQIHQLRHSQLKHEKSRTWHDAYSSICSSNKQQQEQEQRMSSLLVTQWRWFSNAGNESRSE